MKGSEGEGDLLGKLPRVGGGENEDADDLKGLLVERLHGFLSVVLVED
jgi:hypothetical protein